VLKEVCYYCENGRSEGAIFLLTSSCAALIVRGARGVISDSAGTGPGSGQQMQADPGYAMRLYHIKAEAERTPELERLIRDAQDQGWSLHEIVDAIEADRDGTVALIRRRKAAPDRS
jgi:hypothetical protein